MGINDILFSLATKSCEINYNNDTIYCIKNRNIDVINHTIESYYINKNNNGNSRKENDLLLLNEPFYDNHIISMYGDNNYPKEHKIIENSNTKSAGGFGSIFNWFRR